MSVLRKLVQKIKASNEPRRQAMSMKQARDAWVQSINVVLETYDVLDREGDAMSQQELKTIGRKFTSEMNAMDDMTARMESTFGRFLGSNDPNDY